MRKRFPEDVDYSLILLQVTCGLSLIIENQFILVRPAASVSIACSNKNKLTN